MNLLQDKIALITGSSRGLGAEIAKVYAANGAKVVINYLSKTEDAKKTLQSIWTLNGTAIGVPTDIRDLDKVTGKRPVNTV